MPAREVPHPGLPQTGEGAAKPASADGGGLGGGFHQVKPLLTIQSLKVNFGSVAAVDGVSLSIGKGETLGIVGESGCGKSMLSLSIMRLVPDAGRIAAGSIQFDGQDVLTLRPRAMRDLRGRRIAMIFQEPMTSLNPAYTVGDQITEAMRAHDRITSTAELRRRAVAALDRVRIPRAAQRVHDYPHQMSGGMRQRVMIAMALVHEPALLIADEPTTALDVTVQAQVLDLLRDLQQQNGMAILLITHDLGVVAAMAGRVAVMYAGRVVEEAAARDLFADPLHPYTLGLMGSIPRMDSRPGERLLAIEGAVPAPGTVSEGCRFRPRCVFAAPACATTDPALEPFAPVVDEGHTAACIRAPVEAYA